MSHRGKRGAHLCVLLALLFGEPLFAQPLATDHLEILGSSLELETTAASAGVGLPLTIQTLFGGARDGDAPVVQGLSVRAELTGPGLPEPLELTTAPGWAFQIPGLPAEGLYTLRNVRLMRDGEFVEYAQPPVATITVAGVFRTELKVRRLSAEEMRARGIMLDASNYEAYEYVFQFVVDGEIVEVPYPVIIDRRTRAIIVPDEEKKYVLPVPDQTRVPRWDPPRIIEDELIPVGNELPSIPSAPDSLDSPPVRPSVPAAIIIPNELAVLHQFFSVIVAVSNGAPDGSAVTLDGVSARLQTNSGVRIEKSEPAVSFGSAVPIVDAANGVTFLVAQAGGEAEFVLEALKPGLHQIEVVIDATYLSPGVPDIPLRAEKRAAILVHDPRFNITFSHPDTIRDGVEYSTHTFVTNMSRSAQTLRLSTGIPVCPATRGNVCLPSGATDLHELSLDAGETGIVEYRLVPSITGRIFATAGTVEGDAISAAVALTMGVSDGDLPVSPATLVMPWYARYVDESVIDPLRRSLGLAYGLAVAPLNDTTAKLPRVTRSDVFRRAVDLARAGQQIFIGEEELDALTGLSLDLLGNRVPLADYDALRRRETTAASAHDALVGRIASLARDGGLSISQLADRIGAGSVWRPGHATVLAESIATPFKLSIEGASSGNSTADDTLAFTHVTTLDSGSGVHTAIAQLGRFDEDHLVVVEPTEAGVIELELLWPDVGAGLRRGALAITSTAGEPIRIQLTRGAPILEARDTTGAVIASSVGAPVATPPLSITGVRQDLHQNVEGHVVSVLFNRPIAIDEGLDAIDLFTGTVTLQKDGVDYSGPRPLAAAAIQEGNRLVNLTFDHALHTNATYVLDTTRITDPILGGSPSLPSAPIAIDNDRPAGIVFGQVLAGNGAPIPQSEVTLRTRDGIQYDTSSDPEGRFLFEYVPRDSAAGYDGAFRLAAITPAKKGTSVAGTVRLPGRVSIVNLSFLGRGSAEGYVRYEDGSAVSGARVTVGSTMFDQFRETTAMADGAWRVDDLPVGPLTFTARDGSGSVAHAADELRAPGGVVLRNLTIQRKPFPGLGAIRGIIRRSDTLAPVEGARVGVYVEGFGLTDLLTGADGRFSFAEVPAGFVTLLGSEWSLSRESIGVDFQLAAGETRDVELVLQITAADQSGRVEGIVYRESLEYRGDPAWYEPVADALVQIEGLRAIQADSSGSFAYDEVPASFGGRPISAWDPVTERIGKSVVPTVTPGDTASVAILVPAIETSGRGTLRVRLLDAWNQPVSGYRVIEPGFPPRVLDPSPLGEPGIYFLEDAKLNRRYQIRAVPPRTWNSNDPADAGPYGDQFAEGSATLELDGQVLTLELRLPGEGTVEVALRSDIELIGDVELSYSVWDPASQSTRLRKRIGSTDVGGKAGSARFEKVPARQGYRVSSLHPTLGYASETDSLAYQSDARAHVLRLATLSTVTGVVYSIDGITPVGGATVRLYDGRADQGSQATGPDGRFRFEGVSAGTRFRIEAEHTLNGVYRVGRAEGSTLDSGGPVEGVTVVLERQGSLTGRVVYEAYAVFDPLDPTNNVADPTPGDLSDNAPVPLARFHLRELGYPDRSFGSASAPLTADDAGAFHLASLSEGALRISAWDPGNQELRGEWSGAIEVEGEELRPIIAIGDGGVGEVAVLVRNPNELFAPVANSEVTLRIGSTAGSRAFDGGTTNGAGEVRFSQVPEGTYIVTAYSKSLGRFGASDPFQVVAFGIATPVVDLELSGRVGGDLVDPQLANSPVAGAAVTLRGSGFSTLSSTDGTGRFLFDGVREGTVRLDAKDTESNRHASAVRTISSASPEAEVRLALEPTSTLHLEVYLPADDGTSSGALVPAIEATVTQRGGDYHRTLQGNPLVFPGLFLDDEYRVDLEELGGQQRTRTIRGYLPTGGPSDPLRVVLDARGSIEVRVTSSAIPVTGATVRAGSVVGTTDTTGRALLRGLPLHQPISVQATSLDGQFSAADTTTITSQTTPSVVTLALGSYESITGSVEAENGGPSVGTRVVAVVGALTIESRTDGVGRYTLAGIPATSSGVSVALRYIGPDDLTIGARQTIVVSSDATSPVEAPSVRLDATPPSITGIFPEDGAQNVSPDARMKVVFSEPLDPASVTGSRFVLRQLDGNVASTAINGYTTPVGAFVVELSPLPVGGQLHPLASNALYTLVVDGAVTDRAGHPLGYDRVATFRTTDYTEPRVVAVIPDPSTPLQPATTFEIRFSEPIDAQRFATSGMVTLEQLDGPGGTPVRVIAGSAFLNPEATSLFFGPDEELPTEAFFRLSIGGIADEDGNALAPQSFEFFSRDGTAPFVLLTPPAGAPPVVSGIRYELVPDIRDGSATGPVATDIERVDWYRVDSGEPAYQLSSTIAPWAYEFVGPAGSASIGVRAIAFDLSGNESNSVDLQLDVVANEPPAVALALTPSVESYANNRVEAGLTFTDEGLAVSILLEAGGTLGDGSSWIETVARKVSRAAIDEPWPTESFTVALPGELAESSVATFSATVTDASAQNGQALEQITILDDTLDPRITSFLPEAETRYEYGETFELEAHVGDDETGPRLVRFDWGSGQMDVTVEQSRPGTEPGTFVFSTGPIAVPVRNADTRATVSATVHDFGGNETTRSHEIVWGGVDDPSIPDVAWSCPVDLAVVPASVSLPLRLRVQARDDIAITDVSFEIEGQGTVTASRDGSSDFFEARPIVATPAAGEALTITALVSDANPTHLVEMPIRIEAVNVDVEIAGAFAVSPSNLSEIDGKGLLLSSGAELFVTTPLSLANLILLDGATIRTTTTPVSPVPGNDHRVDLTIGGGLYIDCSSAIDVSGRGYLGGWQVDESGARNDDRRGRTLGNTNAGGATGAASHAGLGSWSNSSNAPYGTVRTPLEPGAGGGGTESCCTPGGAGGGAIALDVTGPLALGGGLQADGESGFGRASPGAGGSILVNAAALIAGREASVIANGGDDDPADREARGAGGGRIAISVDERLDLVDPASTILARGGRNGGSEEGVSRIDGGAGTVWLHRPGASSGELIISSHDERHPTTAHLVRPTIIDQTLDLDTLTVGPRSLVVMNSTVTENARSVDASAIIVEPGAVPSGMASSTPASASPVPRDSTILLTWSGASGAPITRLETATDLTTDPIEDWTIDWPKTVTDRIVSVAVPHDAPLGTTTIAPRIVDLADRALDLPAMSFQVVENTPPVIGSVAIEPASGALHAGGVIRLTVDASDDVAVTELTVTTTIDGTVTTDQRFPGALSTSQIFAIEVPNQTPGGSAISIEVAAHDGYPSRAPTIRSETVSVLVDDGAPLVAIVSPEENAIVLEESGTGIEVVATATDAEVAVGTVIATVDAASVALERSGETDTFIGTVPFPPVSGDEPVPFGLFVSARDYAGNETTVTRPILIEPYVSPDAPVIRWICGGDEALYPPGHLARVELEILGNAVGDVSNGVTSAELRTTDPATGAETVVPLTSIGGNRYEGSVTMPVVADGTSVEIRAVASNVASLSTEKSASILVVDGVVLAGGTTIAADDLTLEGETIIVTNGTVTIDGAHTFARLLVIGSGVVTHTPTDPSTTRKLDVSADQIYIACGASIDTTARGYRAGYTWDNTTTGASQSYAGGSHGGRGGYSEWGAPTDSAFSYGSVTRPMTPGGGTAPRGNASGGGTIRVTASALRLDGTLRANGVNGSFARSAGGSVLVEAGSFSGYGSIEARGGHAGRTGGGGRIAIWAESLDEFGGTLRADSGRTTERMEYRGAPGTIYLRRQDTTGAKLSDHLIVDNWQQSAWTHTELASQLPGTITSVNGADLGLSEPVAHWIEGSWIEIYDASDTLVAEYEITSRTDTTVSVDRIDIDDVTAGMRYQTSWRFEELTVGAVSLTSKYSAIISASAPALENGVVVQGNLRRPTIDGGRVAIDTSGALPLIVGAVGAVIDDGTVSVTATNEMTGASFAAAVAPDGSFSLTVDGSSGDTFLIQATDDHTWTLRSEPVPVPGALP